VQQTDPQQLEEPEWLFPFEYMRVGDSFFVPTLRPANLMYIADSRAKQAGIKTRSFAVKQDGILGVRVWRTR
jgi:hypothetical protein